MSLLGRISNGASCLKDLMWSKVGGNVTEARMRDYERVMSTQGEILDNIDKLEEERDRLTTEMQQKKLELARELSQDDTNLRDPEWRGKTDELNSLYDKIEEITDEIDSLSDKRQKHQDKFDKAENAMINLSGVANNNKLALDGITDEMLQEVALNHPEIDLEDILNRVVILIPKIELYNQREENLVQRQYDNSNQLVSLDMQLSKPQDNLRDALVLRARKLKNSNDIKDNRKSEKGLCYLGKEIDMEQDKILNELSPLVSPEDLAAIPYGTPFLDRVTYYIICATKDPVMEAIERAMDKTLQEDCPTLRDLSKDYNKDLTLKDKLAKNVSLMEKASLDDLDSLQDLDDFEDVDFTEDDFEDVDFTEDNGDTGVGLGAKYDFEKEDEIEYFDDLDLNFDDTDETPDTGVNLGAKFDFERGCVMDNTDNTKDTEDKDDFGLCIEDFDYYDTEDTNDTDNTGVDLGAKFDFERGCVCDDGFNPEVPYKISADGRSAIAMYDFFTGEVLEDNFPDCPALELIGPITVPMATSIPYEEKAQRVAVNLIHETLYQPENLTSALVQLYNDILHAVVTIYYNNISDLIKQLIPLIKQYDTHKLSKITTGEVYPTRMNIKPGSDELSFEYSEVKGF